MVSRRRISVAVLVALLATTGTVLAQESQSVKIAFVDVERAVFTIDEGKAKLKQLEDWAKPRQDELAQLGKEINDLQNELNQKRGVASEDALADLDRRLVAKKRQLEDRQRVGKREFDERQNSILQELGNKLNEVITRYADENRFTAVFILKPNDLVYLANSADLTQTIITLYNERFPLGSS